MNTVQSRSLIGLKPRHSREGGNPAPDLSFRMVHAEARRRGGVALRLCASARTTWCVKPQLQGMGPRLRGGDEVRVEDVNSSASPRLRVSA